MDYRYHILNQEDVFKGFFTIRRYQVQYDFFNGEQSPILERECIVKGETVGALVFDKKEQVFVFTEQFRIGAMARSDNAWQIEVIAGFIDKNESPEEAVARELKEEIGTSPLSLKRVHSFYGNLGGSNAYSYLFFAEVDSTQCAHYCGLHDEGEDIKVRKVPFTQAITWLKEGKIDNAMLIIALQTFLLNEEALVC